MKIIALMLTWNNIEFFKCALKQALSFCDEVIAIEGCHLPNYPLRSPDGTYEYIQSIKNEKLVIINIEKFDHTIPNNSQLQCHIRETYLKQSKYWQPGNWVIHWDDDAFYFDKDLPLIKELMESTPANVISCKERRFGFNFRFNVLANIEDFQASVMQKITPGCHFTAPSKMCDKNGLIYIDRLKVPEITFHHYPYVKLTPRAKFRWALSVAKGCTSNKITPKLWDDFSWEKDEDILKQGQLFKSIVGGSEIASVNVYNGPHPEVLDSHPWKDINDIRNLNE